MQKTTRFLAAALLLVLVITSCNLPSGDKPQATQTALFQTVAAGISQTAAAKPSPSATVTQMPTLMLPTASTGMNSALPTLPALPTAAPAVTPCNRASFVADVTIPDGTKIAPSTKFTKTWRLQNTGTCTWDSNYTIVYVSGNMTGPDSTQVTSGSVAPGATVDVTVTITSPATTNTYYSYFRLKATDGTQFGISQNPSGAFYVQIVVSSLTPTVTPTGQVTATITSLSPSSVTAGGSDFIMTLTGTNYISGSVVYWSGTALTTTYVSATSLKATVLAASIASAGTANMTVHNPNGTVSKVVTFTVGSASNPVPTLGSLSPATVNEDTAAFAMTVNGSNFVYGASVLWNGTTLSTNFGSSSYLVASVPANLLTTPGTYYVTVINPSPGGGASLNNLAFSVNQVSPPDNPAPQISTVAPATVTAGADISVIVSGANFVSGSVVRFNGSTDLSTSYNSANQLTATIPAALIPTAGTPASISVFNPLPGGGLSGGFDLTVSPAP